MAAMDWEQMPFFLAVARLGSLRAAGEQLSATHSTVDRHIRALESAYGVQLFLRTRSGLKLTAAGRSLVPIAEDAETLFLGARRRLQGLDKQDAGVVRFSLTGVMAYEIVAPLLTRFFEEYPDIDLEIRVSDRNEDINRLETDVSLRYADEVTEDVVARKLYPMALAPYASRGYLKRHLPNAGPQGQGLHWIGSDEINRHPSWVEQTPFPKAEVRHATTDHIMQLSLLRQGFGMVNTSVYFETIYPELVRVPGGKANLERSLWLLLHSDLRRTSRVRRFVDFMADGLKALKPALQGELA
ncbi:MAG: LysR family transcriptional regulator [Hyphomicrobiales bacterium]|nr:LysR family transcriptional regulator [Hyphomicrobiales bacterium]